MAIDLTKERLMTLIDAARGLPKRRRGKPVHVSCVYRWSTSGCRDVVLETVQVGGTRCTSAEALARFFEKLDRVRSAPPVASAISATSYDERIEAAEKELLGG